MHVIPFSQLPPGIEILNQREIIVPCESGASKILYIKGCHLGRKVKYYVFPEPGDNGGKRPLETDSPLSLFSMSSTEAELGKRGRDWSVTERPTKKALYSEEVLDEVPEEMGHVYISAHSEATRTETVGVIILKSENGERTVRIWADKFDYLTILPDELMFQIVGWTQSSPRSLRQGLLANVRLVSRKLNRLVQGYLAGIFNTEEVPLMETLKRFGHKRRDRRAIPIAVKNRYAHVVLAMGPHLRFVDFDGIKISAKFAKKLALNCPSIEQIRLVQDNLTNSTLEALSTLPSLKSLDLGGCDMNRTVFRILGKMATLERLVLGNTSQMPEKEWVHLQNINELIITGRSCSLGVFVNSLKNLRQLTIWRSTLLSWFTDQTGISPSETTLPICTNALLAVLVNSDTFREGTKIEQVTVVEQTFDHESNTSIRRSTVMARDPVTKGFVLKNLVTPTKGWASRKDR